MHPRYHGNKPKKIIAVCALLGQETALQASL